MSLTLHRAWDSAIRWIQNYLKDCAKHEVKPNYDYIRKYAPRLVRMMYQERKR